MTVTPPTAANIPRMIITIMITIGLDNIRTTRAALTFCPPLNERNQGCHVDDDTEVRLDSDEITRFCEKDTSNASTARRPNPTDIEKTAAHEHVLLAVEGMTCTGCGNKLTRTLEAIPGISNVQVSFVMGSADFDVDPSMSKVEDIVRTAQKATGFRCARTTSGEQFINLLMTRESVKSLSEDLPAGVKQIDLLDKSTARITYDPTVVGARSLVAALGLHTTGLAPPRADASVSGGRKRLLDMLIKTTLAAFFTIPVVVLAWGDTLVDEHSRAYISIVFATVVQALAVPEFYQPAISSLIFSRTVEMDMLVVISISAAYIYSEFFETSTLLITLVLLGRLIAAFARMRAVAAVSLRSLQASTAVLVEGEETREVDARLLQFGDRFMIMPHAQIPTDGLVTEGVSEVDESMLTGESLPVEKKPGAQVIAGTLNGSGRLTAKLARLPGKNTVTDIANLVEEASNTKPKVQELADKVAGYFVPVVTAIAVIVIIVWVVVSLRVRNESGGKAVSTAITYAIAVLAVSCPCALGLAVPMVLVVAGGVAARGGVVIKSAESIERGHKITDVVFDKTGTLTMGELDVVAEDIVSADYGQVVSIAKALVNDNKHPISVAVAKHLEKQEHQAIRLEDVRVIPRAGVEATWNGSLFRAGNAHWLGVGQVPEVDRLLQQGMTTLCFTKDTELLAVFGLTSILRPEAGTVVRELHTRKITVHLVSGDEERAVEAVARTVGIPMENAAARRSPAEKRVYVQELIKQGKRVAFCGDGTNDAVAIAQANIGIQMGSSSDITRATADVVLLSGLDGIIYLLEVSKASFRRIAFNFVWSAIYNVLAILLAAGAFIRIRIPPAYAGLGEVVSVLPVIIAALTMSGMKRQANL
ncbi:hypothetical protein H2199_002945 [Coniosporium tulheliwenetii]|uniref:Uncharacterized protein n=1 Tax=Coniosporium tulheliwenetii TaxID=3383036 RepID=A0ACC2ZDT1_9PEZI|nr:hypothetical protein H2199_002945 [Cladosporium sp. JES 115]